MQNSSTTHTLVNAASAAVHRLAESAHSFMEYAGNFLKNPEEWESEWAESYLVEAVDSYNLEYRKRELDRLHALQLDCLIGFSH